MIVNFSRATHLCTVCTRHVLENIPLDGLTHPMPVLHRSARIEPISLVFSSVRRTSVCTAKPGPGRARDQESPEVKTTFRLEAGKVDRCFGRYDGLGGRPYKGTEPMPNSRHGFANSIPGIKYFQVYAEIFVFPRAPRLLLPKNSPVPLAGENNDILEMTQLRQVSRSLQHPQISWWGKNGCR